MLFLSYRFLSRKGLSGLPPHSKINLGDLGLKTSVKILLLGLILTTVNSCNEGATPESDTETNKEDSTTSDDDKSDGNEAGKVDIEGSDDFVKPGSISLDIHESGRTTGPKITGTLDLGTSLTQSCEIPGKPTLNTIYSLIKDFPGSDIISTMENCTDGSNMYVALEDAKMMSEQAIMYCKEIPKQTVVPNFNWGEDGLARDIEYNCFYEAQEGGESTTENSYYSSYVMRETENQVYGNFGHYHTEPGSQKSPRSLQYFYDDETKDFVVNQAYLVQYEDGSSYGPMVHLAGNLSTKLFTVKLWSSNGSDTDNARNSISIGGYGKAEDGYFLFKVCSSNEVEHNCNFVNNKYYCFEAGVDVATIAAWPDSEDGGKTADEISSTSCSEYLDEVDAITLFTDEDAPLSESDFTGSGTGNYKLDVDPELKVEAE